MKTPERITFAWWNLHDFAHHDAARISVARWPKDAALYEAKRDRILAALGNLAGGAPDLIAVCEITRAASADMLARLPDDFMLLDSPESSHEDPFQIAVYYRKGVGFIPQLPLLSADELDVSRGTRPMLVLHLAMPGHIIRFVACHWTGMNEASSRTTRNRLADFLRSDIHEFLLPATPPNDSARHVVVFGDLNEEPPHELFMEYLPGHRDRMSSRKEVHWRDSDVRRVHLYDLAWRFLGEQHPHQPGRPTVNGPAGTFYSKNKGWRTYDHVLVSGGLLGDEVPMLDERNTQVVALPILCDERGLPFPFVAGSQTGVSDHLPIVGQIILREKTQ